jgi:hypothetical protein
MSSAAGKFELDQNGKIPEAVIELLVVVVALIKGFCWD